MHILFNIVAIMRGNMLSLYHMKKEVYVVSRLRLKSCVLSYRPIFFLAFQTAGKCVVTS